MRSSTRTSSALVAIFAIFALSFASTAWAAPVDAAGEARDHARQAFAEGRRLYDAGRFADAIAQFKEAERLAPSPLLWFNMAQAYRKEGACPEALAAYRAFLGDAPDARADLRAVAKQHADELGLRCGAPSSTVAMDAAPGTDPVTAPAPPATVPPAAPPPRDPATAVQVTAGGSSPARRTNERRWLVPAALISGASLLLATGGVLLWRDHENSLWSEEDARLRQRKTEGMFTTDDIARQNSNDDRLQTVDRLGAIAIGTGVAGAALLLAGGSVSLFRSLSARPAPNGGVSVAFSLSY